MVKYCIDKYPLGSFPGQKSPGRYIDETLHDNLQILAQNIVRDLTFLIFVFSSTLEVGTGKSVFIQQIAEAITEQVNKLHNLNIPFDINNIVFHPRDLIERSFKVPKYSVIILDEWTDAHFWSELGITLREFFRKCRQLNLFMICVIPNFFELPKGYAISRSVAAIDVKFVGNFERGFFDFYSFKKKKELYLKGKKNYDYDVVKPSFIGRFTDGFVVGREIYLNRKRLDLERHDKQTKEIQSPTAIKKHIFHQIYTNLPEMTIKRLAFAFGTSERSCKRWLAEVRAGIEGVVGGESGSGTELLNNLNKSDDDDGGEEEE